MSCSIALFAAQTLAIVPSGFTSCGAGSAAAPSERCCKVCSAGNACGNFQSRNETPFCSTGARGSNSGAENVALEVTGKERWSFRRPKLS